MRRIIPALLLGFSLATPAIAEEPVEKVHTLNLGYNALEVGLADTGIRTRLFTGVDVGKNFQIGYKGLNEVSDFDPQTYFGRHLITCGERSWKLKHATLIKTD